MLAGVTVLALVGAACGDDTDGGDGVDPRASRDRSRSPDPRPCSPSRRLLPSSSTRRTPTSRSPWTVQERETASSSSARARSTSRMRLVPIEDDEATACADGGIEYTELEVALDGITVMVNAASPIECLTTADLYAIFGPESDGIDSTTQANTLSQEVGGAGDMPAQDLEVTAPGEESGTYDAFIDLAGIEDTALENGVAEDDAAALRGDYTSSPNDNVIIQAMEGSPNAIGFVGFAFAEGSRRCDQGGRGRRRRRLRGADGRDHRRRQLPAVAVALHLPEHHDGRRRRSAQGLRRLLPDRGRARRARSSWPSTSRSRRSRQDATRSAWESAVS